VYTAQQALDAKLIDRIGYMDDALELTKKAIGVDQAKVVVYHRPSEYRATYYARSEAPSSSVDGSLSRLATVLGSGPGFFYLWWPLAAISGGPEPRAIARAPRSRRMPAPGAAGTSRTARPSGLARTSRRRSPALR